MTLFVQCLLLYRKIAVLQAEKQTATEIGFYFMALVLALLAAVLVQ
jgi:uncharacterized membrane protein YiaA